MLVPHRIALAIGILLLAAQTTTAQPTNFVATLSGDQEVPPVETRAHGVAKLQLDASGTELSYRLAVSRLEGVTQAHIHCGTADVNGPVVAFLFALMPGGVDIEGVLASGGITDADVIARPDSPECPGGVEDLDDVVARLEAGEAYVNVHTLDQPGGEVRGQVQSPGNGAR